MKKCALIALSLALVTCKTTHTANTQSVPSSAPTVESGTTVSTSFYLAQDNEYVEFQFCNSVSKACSSIFNNFLDLTPTIDEDYDLVFARSCIYNGACNNWYRQNAKTLSSGNLPTDLSQVQSSSYEIPTQQGLNLTGQSQAQTPQSWLNSELQNLSPADEQAVILAGGTTVGASAVVGGIIAVESYPTTKGAVRYFGYFAYKWHLGGGKEEYAGKVLQEGQEPSKIPIDNNDQWVTAWDWDKTLTEKTTMPFQSSFPLKPNAIKTLKGLIAKNVYVVVVSQNSNSKIPTYLTEQLTSGEDSLTPEQVARYFTVLQPTNTGLGSKDEMLAGYLKTLPKPKGDGITRVVAMDDTPQQLLDMVNSTQVESIATVNSAQVDPKLRPVQVMGVRVQATPTYEGHFDFVKANVGKTAQVGGDALFEGGKIYEL